MKDFIIGPESNVPPSRLMKNAPDVPVLINRTEFRSFFQPSRIVLGVIYDKKLSRYNIIPFAFNMYTSYSPLMFAIAVQNINYSFELLTKADEFVLAIPGEKLANEVIYCGSNHGNKVDKFKETGLVPLEGTHITTVGISEAVANIECKKRGFFQTGDHAVVVGEVLCIKRNGNSNEQNLLSISERQESDYKLLCRSGIHRIAISYAHEMEEVS